MNSETKYEVISHSEPKLIIYNYFNTLFHKLPPNFYQSLVEKENEISLHKNPDMKLINELNTLYQVAIESFSGISNNKANFFKRKLAKLNHYYYQKEKKVDHKRSKFSEYIHQHKAYSNQLMLFIQLNKSKNEIKNLMVEHSNHSKIVNEQIEKEIIMQKEKLTKNLIVKKNNSKNKSENKKKIAPQIVYTSDTINYLEKYVEAFLKNFHYVYLHSKIFETPVECLNQVLDEVYYQKIKKYYFYQEQIKQFQLLLGDEEGAGQHQESLQFYLDDLEKERSSYLEKMEEKIKELNEKITNKCLNTSIEEDAKVKQYKNELINNLGSFLPND